MPTPSEVPSLARAAATLTAAVALAAAPSAQVPLPEPAQVSPAARPEVPRVERNYLGSYSASHSRELFRACDANSDDRLDVLETADAFDVLPSARDHEGFARFDSDRDGYVSWPEFDQRFRRAVDNGGTFRVRTCRPFVAPEPPPQPPTRLQQFLRLHDADGDGGLDKAEIDALLAKGGLPGTLAVTLLQADLDGSGRIEEAELAPWFQALPIAQLAGLGAPAAQSTLPQPYYGADGDRDGTIDEAEFRQLLRRLDPTLIRWTRALLDKLDRDGDGRLQQDELPAPHAPAADRPDRRPADAPQR